MEHRSHDPSDEQSPQPTREQEGGAVDTDVRFEIMSRDKRLDALAWAQAYRLVRGGVDEIVEMIEASQFTIELLLEALRDAACRRCDAELPQRDDGCDFCRRREELLTQLA